MHPMHVHLRIPGIERVGITSRPVTILHVLKSLEIMALLRSGYEHFAARACGRWLVGSFRRGGQQLLV